MTLEPYLAFIEAATSVLAGPESRLSPTTFQHLQTLDQSRQTYADGLQSLRRNKGTVGNVEAPPL
jgi:hypothetical protein